MGNSKSKTTKIENDYGAEIGLWIVQYPMETPKKTIVVPCGGQAVVSHNDVNFRYNPDRFIGVKVMVGKTEMGYITSAQIKEHKLVKLSMDDAENGKIKIGFH